MESGAVRPSDERSSDGEAYLSTSLAWLLREQRPELGVSRKQEDQRTKDEQSAPKRTRPVRQSSSACKSCWSPTRPSRRKGRVGTTARTPWIYSGESQQNRKPRSKQGRARRRGPRNRQRSQNRWRERSKSSRS